eukprot:ANDGO_05480.mRNA.1 Kelch-like protein diablo
MAVVPHDVGADLRAFVNSPELSDVTIFVGPSQKPIYGHKFILATRSEYFRALLYGPGEESRTGKIYFPDTDIPSMERVLNFVYTGRCDLDAECVLSVLILANFLRLEALQKLCSVFVEQYIDAENVCKLYDTACLLQVQEMKEVCSTVLMSKFADATSTEDFLKLSRDTLLDFLQTNISDVPEIEVFRSVITWIRANHPNLNAERDREKLRSLFSFIRFPFMDPKDLVEIVEPTGLVPLEYLCEAYRFMATGEEWHQFPLSKYRFEGRLSRECHVSFAFPSADSACSGPSQTTASLGQHWQEGNRFWQDGDEVSESFKISFVIGGKLKADSIQISNAVATNGSDSRSAFVPANPKSKLVIRNSRWIFQIRDQLNVNDIQCTFTAYINDVEVGDFIFRSTNGSNVYNHELDVSFSHRTPIEVDRQNGIIKLAVRSKSTVPGGYGSWIWAKGGSVQFF